MIDLLGFDDLTNEASGWRSVQNGRRCLSELAFYFAKPADVTVPALLIRINLPTATT